jgi:3-hydroxyisobutyrate dehydrogenase
MKGTIYRSFSLHQRRSSWVNALLVGPLKRSISIQDRRFLWATANHEGLPKRATAKYSVGFVGLGNMGLPMALNLAKGEIVSSVVVFDTHHGACLTAVDQGNGKVTIAQSLPAMGAAAADGNLDAIFTMLPTCDAVDTVMKRLQEGWVEKEVDVILDDLNVPSRDFPVCVVDCSTVNPTTSRNWNKLWVECCGYLMYDAPVSGGAKGSAAGTLTFMVGAGGDGDSDRVEQRALNEVVEPLLLLMGTNIIRCGSPGSGATTKLCNNVALATQMVGICEAMNLGERLGVDPIVLAQAMNVSTASCWSSKINNPHPIVAAFMAKQSNMSIDESPPASREYQGGFATNLMWKDLQLALTAADDCGGVTLPLTSRTKKLYQSASTKGYGKKDFGVMFEFLKTLDKPP